MKILITGGGCREAIDGVRFVTNMSTGHTSAFLADAFAQQGAEVTAIMAKGSILPAQQSVNLMSFESGEDLSAALHTAITKAADDKAPYTAIIHAAAVSDFIPKTITIGGETYQAGKHLKKLHSGTEMTVTFEAAPKIADRIRSWITHNTKLFCFKLTNGASEAEQQQAVEKLFSHSAADYIIQNDLTQITANTHPFAIIDANGTQAACGKTLSDMGSAITALCK